MPATSLVTIPEISRELGSTKERVRGWIEALRIRKERIGTADAISRRDFERLKARVAREDREPIGA